MKKYSRLFIYYLYRLGFRFRLETFYFYNLDLEAIINFHENDKVNILEISKENLLEKHIKGWITISQAKQILSRHNNYFFVAFENNEIIGSCFLETEIAELDYLDCHSTIPNNSSYITHVIVLQKNRGRGIALKLLESACAKSKAIGKQCVSISCTKNNIQIQKSISKLKFKKTQAVTYFRFILFRAYFVNKINSNTTLKKIVFLSRNLNPLSH